MQHVQLVGGHRPHQPAQTGQALEVPTHVDHHASVTEAGCVEDGDGGQCGEGVLLLGAHAVVVEEVQERSDCMKNALAADCTDPDAVLVNAELVGAGKLVVGLFEVLLRHNFIDLPLEAGT